MKKLLDAFLILGIFVLIGATVANNYREKNSIDRSRLPAKIETSKGFQRWITNLKNKDFIVNADDFKLIEENEVYNTTKMTVSSIDDNESKKLFDSEIEKHKNISKVVFSPSGRQFIDYRHEIRENYMPFDAHYYGLREDKIVDSKILSCSEGANCYFDRAYFLDNDVFVISEFSRNIKEGEIASPCSVEQQCTYTIKVHVIDLNKNSRLVYESEPIELILAKASQNF